MKSLLVLPLGLLVLLSLTSQGRAATINAANCSQQAVQAAVNSASDNDTIIIPAGACTWTSTLTINSLSSRTKMVKLIGAGTDPSTGTRITCSTIPAIDAWLSHSISGLRISNIRFIQTGSSEPWAIRLSGHADTYASLFRIDHCYFQYATGGTANAVYVGLLNSADTTYEANHPYIWGVFDHNYFKGTVSFQGIDTAPVASKYVNASWENDGHGAWRDWTIADHSGTWKNVFFEDNTAESDTYTTGSAFIDAEAGAAYVFRNNTLKNLWVANHGFMAFRSCKWVEAYNNVIILDDPYSYQFEAFNTKGGTGVYYSNQLYDAARKGTCMYGVDPLCLAGGTYVGAGVNTIYSFASAQLYRVWRTDGPVPCAGTMCSTQGNPKGCDNWDSSSAPNPGWLCADQVGTKKGADDPTFIFGYRWASEPVYTWSNYYTSLIGMIVGPGTNTGNYIRIGTEIINNGIAPKPGYMAYTYPHPLTLSGPLQNCSSLNGICCSSGQTCSGSFTSSSDCSYCCVMGTCQASLCGNGQCDSGECNTCLQDCTLAQCCGDGTCQPSLESCQACSADCLTVGQVCCSGSVYTGNCCSDSNCTSPQTCTSHVCTQPPAGGGLVAAYSFDEGAGNSVGDSSGNGNTGTVNGPTWTAGKYGSALSFDGVDDYVRIPDSASLHLVNFTLSFWFNVSSWPTYNPRLIAKKNNWGTMDWELLHVAWSNSLEMIVGEMNGADVLANLRYSPAAGAWHHIAITKNGTIYALFSDGVSKGTDTSAINWTDSDSIFIGKDGSASGYEFPGFIDELRIYNRALNQSEIQANMNTPVVIPCIHKSDNNPCDGCVVMTELSAFLSRWYINNLDVTMKELIEAIGLWNKGCP